MPKLHNTRRERAQELLKTVTRGPSFALFMPEFRKAARREYQWWAEECVIAELKKLIPELRSSNGKPRLP